LHSGNADAQTDPPPRGSQDMREKAKRWFWQFHLSTAIAVSIVSAFLLLMNFQRREPKESLGTQYGWPLTAYRAVPDHLIRLYPVWKEEAKRFPQDKPLPDLPVWYQDAAAMNAVVAASILLVLFVSFEWLIRRREARKA
jgi:hypothetical protein